MRFLLKNFPFFPRAAKSFCLNYLREKLFFLRFYNRVRWSFEGKYYLSVTLQDFHWFIMSDVNFSRCGVSCIFACWSQFETFWLKELSWVMSSRITGDGGVHRWCDGVQGSSFGTKQELWCLELEWTFWQFWHSEIFDSLILNFLTMILFICELFILTSLQSW